MGPVIGFKLGGGKDPEPPHLARELGDRSEEPAGPDVIERVGNGVKADDRDVLQTLRSIGGLEGAEGHLVVGGKDGVDLGVSLEEVFRDVVGQRPFPVGGLAGDHSNAG